MEVNGKPNEAVPRAWLLACRATSVAGAVAFGAAGLAQVLEATVLAETLQWSGVVLAGFGWAAEVVLSGLAAPVIAALVAVPALVGAVSFAFGRTEDPAGAGPIGPAGAVMVAMVAPFLAAAARSLAFQATSTSHVGMAGGVVALFGGVAVAVDGGMNPEAVTLFAVAGTLLVAYALSDRENLTELAGSRSVRYGSGSLVLTALFGGTAVGGYAIARRNDHTFDWSRTQAYQLSGQSRTVLAELAYDVEVKAFYRPRSDVRPPVEDLLRRMQEVGPRLHVTWIDPLANPLAAKEALITGDHGVLVFEANGRQRRLEGEIREEEVVRELLLLGSDTEHVVCWVMGHGEPDPDQDELPEGFGGMRSDLEALNYKFVPVRTAQEPIPSTCEVLVFARPALDPLPYEQEALAAYLGGGGQAVVMVDLYARKEVLFDVPAFTDSLVRYGVSVGRDVVFDLNEKHRMLDSTDPTMVVMSGADFSPHPLTRSLGAALVLPGTRSVRFTAVEGLEGAELLHTSRDAWAETTPDAPEPNRGTEIVGEVPVMVVVEVRDPAALHVASAATAPSPESSAPASEETVEPGRPAAPAAPDPARGVPADYTPAPGGRLVVFGDTDFASNQYLALGNNRDLVLNLFAWLVSEDEQLGERPEGGEPLELSDAQGTWLCLSSVGFIPGIALLIALSVMVRRRNL